MANVSALAINLGLVASHSGQGVAHVACRGACACHGVTCNLHRKHTRVTIEDSVRLQAAPQPTSEACRAYYTGEMCEVLIEATHSGEGNSSRVSLRSIAMFPTYVHSDAAPRTDHRS